MGSASGPGWGRRRFVVIRRSAPEETSWELDLFQLELFHYQAFVTNLPCMGTTDDTRFHHKGIVLLAASRKNNQAFAIAQNPTIVSHRRTRSNRFVPRSSKQPPWVSFGQSSVREALIHSSNGAVK